MLGVLASATVNPAIADTFKMGTNTVSLAGSAGQFFNQVVGVLFTAGFAAVATIVILYLVKALVGLRVSNEDEDTGLDLTQHGESAYND